ncbi:MAG: tyrosine-type recombinase/integrase, partial [Oscillospiraceae bacterium]|nr:tyrosine-type recombinase/integrase [Oscillospiraceae bacterium]
CALALRDTDKKYIWETHRKKNHPCNPTYFRDQFRKALEAIPEVRVLTPHSCRHTYVSQMIALGVDLATVMELVGHSTTRMTERYLHVQREAQLNAAERFSNAFPTNRDSAAPPDNVLDLSNAI